MKDTVSIDIFWQDLTLEARKKIVEALGCDESEAETQDFGNWNVFPIAILDFDKEAWGVA